MQYCTLNELYCMWGIVQSARLLNSGELCRSRPELHPLFKVVGGAQICNRHARDYIAQPRGLHCQSCVCDSLPAKGKPLTKPKPSNGNSMQLLPREFRNSTSMKRDCTISPSLNGPCTSLAGKSSGPRDYPCTTEGSSSGHHRLSPD